MQAKDLERIISHLDTLYEQGEDCIHPDTGEEVSDGEYDALRRQLKQLKPNSDLFKTATASQLDSGVKKVKHNPPLTSIEKASHEDKSVQIGMFKKWLADCEKGTTSGFAQSYKLDGAAVALYYEKGLLVAAGTRPRNGIDGEDVTEQVKYVEDIPQKLKLPVTCSIRGELICKLSDFAKVQKELARLGEKLRANPRNHTAGGIRQFKEPEKVKQQRLSFIGYSIEGLANPPYKTEIERAKWANKELGVRFVQVRPYRFEDLDKMEEFVSELDYLVDGVIIAVNNLEDQEQLGRHGDPKTGNPKGKIAWKFAEEEANPAVNGIEWQTGRTGRVKPVAVFDAVPLAGTNVRRATLHNAGFIIRNKITIGTIIRVLKAGNIIPKVVGVVSGQGKYKMPDKCPSCQKQLVLQTGGTEDMQELVCKNQYCPARNVSGLCHYLATVGVLGLGEATVTQLVEGGKVKTPADFYKLDIRQTMKCGLSKRESLLALGGIHLIPNPEKLDDDDLEKRLQKAMLTKKEIPLWQVFAALGIQSAGKSAGKALVDHFGDFDIIRSSTVEELESVSDVGSKTAVVLYEYFREHASEIDDLLTFVAPTLPKKGKLSGKTFCFSGSFDDGKKFWEDQVESLGGKCVSSVGRKVDYLVAGPGSGSKSDKANELGVPVLNVDELRKML